MFIAVSRWTRQCRSGLKSLELSRVGHGTAIVVQRAGRIYCQQAGAVAIAGARARGRGKTAGEFRCRFKWFCCRSSFWWGSPSRCCCGWSGRAGALVGGETKIRDIALGQPNWPPGDPDRQLLPQPVRAAAAVLCPDRAGAAAPPCRSGHRADVLGVRGHAFRPCRDFRDLQRRPGRRSMAWFAGVLVLFAMWLYFALKILLLI